MEKYVANYCPACGHKMEQSEAFGTVRPVCPSCNHIVFFDPKVSVIAFITKQQQVLLVQRDVEPAKGLWSLPGGYVELGEHPTDALKREILEETGLTIEVHHVLDVFYTPSHNNHVVVIAYQAEVNGGKIQAADDAAQVQWFTKGNLPELAFQSTKSLIIQWQD